jgi:hypothetical protein
MLPKGIEIAQCIFVTLLHSQEGLKKNKPSNYLQVHVQLYARKARAKHGQILLELLYFRDHQ